MTTLNFKGIKIFDNVLSPIEVASFRNLVLKTPMIWSGRDRPDTPINGVMTNVRHITKDNEILHSLQRKLFSTEPQLQQHQFINAGINLTVPLSNPMYFHTDGDIITCLFYLTPKVNYDLDDGGETQFDFGDYVVGTKSKSGRLVIFDGNIQHRATYYRNDIRITVFFKFKKNSSTNVLN